MNNLYQKLKKYSLEDTVGFEKSDRQFLALEKLYREKLFSDDIYLFLIIANALVCYQLSGSGEDYWEEFSDEVVNKKINNFEDIEKFFVEFLPVSKNNRRLVDVKSKRIKKIVNNVQLSDIQRLDFEAYYKNMQKLVGNLAIVMNQKTDAKTIVFAVKMFSYGARNVFSYLEYFPNDIIIPLDNRLEKLYYKYNIHKVTVSKKEIQNFYNNLSQRLRIPPLHLDSLLWVNYKKFIK